MINRNFYFLITSLVLSAHSLSATDTGRVDTQKIQNSKQENQYNQTEDVWFGPGFYYGIWFDNEDEYWGWRGNHLDYPRNREYYNHDHPVDYYPNGRGEGEEHRSAREEEDARREGGMREGGGRRR
jgi:hypothetical protein